MATSNPAFNSKNIHAVSALKFDRLSVFVLFCGLTSPIIIQALGLLFLGEIVLSLFGILILLNRFFPSPNRSTVQMLSSPILQQSLIALSITFFGYFISDWHAHSSTADCLRGWARLVFLILDIVALCCVSIQNRWNLWWFSIGLGVGGVIRSIIIGDIFNPENWKGLFSPAISLLLLICTSPIPNQYILAGLIGLFGLVNVLLDARILALQCLVVSAITWVKIKNVTRIPIKKILISLGIAFLLLLTVYSHTEGQYASRRDGSNVTRLAGYQVAVKAILESPVLGYGSWAKNKEYANEYIDLIKLSYPAPLRLKLYQETAYIPAHSQIVQAWIEGGIFGIAFFLWYGYRLIWGFMFLVNQPFYNRFFPLFLFNVVTAFWHFLASPFASGHRITMAISIATLCILNLEDYYNVRQRQL
jgi:O-antigen ligase